MNRISQFPGIFVTLKTYIHTFSKEYRNIAESELTNVISRNKHKREKNKKTNLSEKVRVYPDKDLSSLLLLTF